MMVSRLCCASATLTLRLASSVDVLAGESASRDRASSGEASRERSTWRSPRERERERARGATPSMYARPPLRRLRLLRVRRLLCSLA